MLDKENEKLNIWLNFWKFFLGSFFITILSISLNYLFKQNKLDLQAQQIEDKYIDNHLEKYMKQGDEQKMIFINFLRHLTIDDKRRANYDSLYKYLEKEKKLKITLNKQELDSIQFLFGEMNNQIKMFEEQQDSLLILSKKIKNNIPNDEKIVIQEKLVAKSKLIDSLEVENKKHQLKIIQKEQITNKLQHDISHQEPEQREGVKRIKTLKIDLEKEQKHTIDSLGISFFAKKVNNITKKAIIQINTKEINNNPSYILGINRYALFSKNGITYKLLATKIYNNRGINKSHVVLEFSVY